MFQVIPLLVGFTGGQVHLIDPVHKVGLHLQGIQQVVYFIVQFHPSRLRVKPGLVREKNDHSHSIPPPPKKTLETPQLKVLFKSRDFFCKSPY